MFASCRKISGRNGFTVVELLVVITIIGMLMSIALPGLGAAREMGNRTSCIRKIGQLATGVVNRATSRQGGKMPDARPTVGGGNGASQNTWAFSVLPYVGLESLYDQLSSGSGNASEFYEEVFICDSDPPEIKGNAPLSYCANAGRANPNDKKENGCFSDSSVDPPIKISLGGFPDGESNTIIIAENVDATTWWAPGVNEFDTNIVWGGSGLQFNESIGEADGEEKARPSSRHPSGVVVAFCDGRARFLSEDIAYNTYAKLMTSDGANCSAPQNPPTVTAAEWE